MRQFNLTILFLVTFFTASYSQVEYQIRQAIDFYSINKFHSGEGKTSLSESDIEGSPYLNDEFINGTIYTTSKQKFLDIPLRYNIYNDDMEYKTPENKIQAIASPDIVEAAEFGNYKIVYVPYSNAKKVRKGFFMVEAEGEAMLLRRFSVTYKEAEEPAPYKDAIPPRFLKKPDTFYIKVGTEEAKKVNNKKELIEILSNHKNEISSFIKKNKIKTNKPELLKQLLEYYNSL